MDASGLQNIHVFILHIIIIIIFKILLGIGDNFFYHIKEIQANTLSAVNWT